MPTFRLPLRFDTARAQRRHGRGLAGPGALPEGQIQLANLDPVRVVRDGEGVAAHPDQLGHGRGGLLFRR